MLTVHHLNQSRSQRVLWALEELQLSYQVVCYQREKNMQAPAELKKIHPLGKSPVLEDQGRGAGGVRRDSGISAGRPTIALSSSDRWGGKRNCNIASGSIMPRDR